MTPNRYYTNSELNLFKDCRRHWYIRHYLKLARKRERVNESREIGNGVHYAVAEMYNSNFELDPKALVVEYYARAIAEQETHMEGASEGAQAVILENIETLRKAQEFAEKMVEGYVEWLEEEGADSYLRFISAEEELAVEIPDSDSLPRGTSQKSFLLGKLDARFIDERNGARVFMDHKSVQNFSDREKWAHLDPQFRFYSLIEYLLLLQEEVAQMEWTDGGIVNMMRRVKRTGSAKPPFFKRLEVRTSPKQLESFYIQMIGEITTIQQTEIALETGVDNRMVCPPSPSKDCDWKCPYTQVCPMFDDGSDVEGYMEANLIISDPLARYEEYS